jgi:hypothetical protein
MQWTEFFLRRLPLNFQSGRLQFDAEGDLDDILGYFKRLDGFIKHQVLSLTNGKVQISKKNQALTFLYGC